MTEPSAPEPLAASGLLERIGRLRAARAGGRMTADELADELALLRVADAAGTVWTIGARSGAWYAFRDGEWTADGDGPSGGPVPEAARDGSPAAGTIDYLEHGIGTLPEPVVDDALPVAPMAPPPPMANPAPPMAIPAPPIAAPPILAPPILDAPNGRRRRGGLSTVRRVLSAGSLVAGLALTGASVVGALPLGTTPVVGVDPGRSPAPTSVAIAPTPVAPTSSPSIAPASGPAATLTLSASPVLPGSLWFEDTFSSEGAFWTGSGEYATATYRDGSYDVRFKPVDLPVLLSAVAGEGSPGPRVRVEATFRLVSGPADAEYGLVVTDVGGTRHLELAVEADGRYALYRDDVESFSSVLAGTRADLAGHRPITLRLDIGPDGSKTFVDGLLLGQSDATFTPGGFGIAVRTTSGNARLLVDDYRVWQLGD